MPSCNPGDAATNMKGKLNVVLFTDYTGILCDQIYTPKSANMGLVRLQETRWIHKIKFISTEWSGIDVFKMSLSSDIKILHA